MSWSLHNLAPICIVPHCPLKGTRHLLPHQEEIATQILTGDEIYIYWQGGVGSAKTLLWGVLAAALAISIPNAQYILFRRDYGDNYLTLWKYFKGAIKAACEQGIIQARYEKLWSVKKQGDHTVCELPNSTRIYAGQLKDWSVYMGPSYDGIFVSDAMENPNFGEIFRGEGVVGGLQSRLRGQESSFYEISPHTYKDMRRFCIESNPPPNINALHELFGREPGVRTLPGIDITYRHIQTSSIQNDHNPPSYVREIASMHSNPGDILRILEGKTVPYYGGVRVIPSFTPEIHVSKFVLDPSLLLFCGIDPGKQHPSCIFGQIRRCAYDKEHFISLSEITNLYDKTTSELAEYEDSPYLGILAHLSLFYPSYFDYEMYKQIRKSLLRAVGDNTSRIQYTVLEQHFSHIRFCIDRSGKRVYSTQKDRKTDQSILLTEYGIRTRSRTNIGLDKSLDRVIEAHKTICACGIPLLMYDQNCEMLIDAYSGGYRYPKLKDGTHGPEPIKDHRYEDPADAHRYVLENLYFTTYVEEERIEDSSFPLDQSPWAWMGKIPQEGEYRG